MTGACGAIQKLKKTPGISGMHIMAVHWESIVPRLIEEADVPRPVVKEMPATNGAAKPAAKPKTVVSN